MLLPSLAISKQVVSRSEHILLHGCYSTHATVITQKLLTHRVQRFLSWRCSSFVARSDRPDSVNPRWPSVIAPKRMGVALSLLAQLKSQAFSQGHTPRGHTPRGILRRPKTTCCDSLHTLLTVTMMYRKSAAAYHSRHTELLS